MRKIAALALKPGLFLLFVLSGFTVAAQQEKPADSVKIKEPVITWGRQIAYFNTATGRILGTDGKWLSSPNRIPFDDNDYNSEYYDKFKLGTHNFNSISVREIKVDTISYLALIIPYATGYYRDYDGEEKWVNYTNVEYYLVDKAAWQAAWNDSMTTGEKYFASMKVYHLGTFYNKNAANILADMSAHLKEAIMNPPRGIEPLDPYYQIVMWPVKNGNVSLIRFYTFLNYSQPGQPPREPTMAMLDKQHYQAAYSTFKAFLKAR
ncbi:MAG: hypothetical protein M3Q97_00925 [Bacteroidota bacterium]|nr:hypothetical protein [Bacteroidota bacterium]